MIKNQMRADVRGRRRRAGLSVAGAGILLTFGMAASPTLAASGADAPHVLPGTGYVAASSDGGVFAYGQSGFYGSTYTFGGSATTVLGASLVGINQPWKVSTQKLAAGYWVVASNGGVCDFGPVGAEKPAGTWTEADGCYGPVAGTFTGTTVTGVAGIAGLAGSPADGYWLTSANGGAFAYGGVGYYGSPSQSGLLTSGHLLSGIATTSDGLGYWLVGQDGGVYAYGDAGFFGSMGGSQLQSGHYAVGIAPTPDNLGYWLVGQDGGVFAFGDAAFYGSLAPSTLPSQMTGIAASQSGGGYWLAGGDGLVYSLGAADYLGSPAGALTAGSTIVGISQ